MKNILDLVKISNVINVSFFAQNSCNFQKPTIHQQMLSYITFLNTYLQGIHIRKFVINVILVNINFGFSPKIAHVAKIQPAKLELTFKNKT